MTNQDLTAAAMQGLREIALALIALWRTVAGWMK
jgi:hypothetical protein